ncbi:MAG: helix-hairpin-helix domain-containing protein [Blautia sp.]|nr:helix-hairpin-helix domain-containing protein [Blautia sp.]
MKNIARISECIAMCVLLAGCGHRGSAEFLLNTQRAEAVEEVTAEQQERQEAEAVLLVYVCGQVQAPGVYELPAGSRICDALKAAGGLTDLASPDYWNLAEPLEDGAMISFPTREEAEEKRAAEEVQAVSSEAGDGRVNINTADLARLMRIPGIGQARGEAILAYRSEHGAFAKEEDILQVSGIGSAVFEGMRDYITVD